MPKGVKVIAENRKARHDYFVLDTLEAGIELKGTEVKSIRAGAINLKDSFAHAKNGEMFLYNVHISPYEKGNIFNRDPLRPRKLLLHKREILKLSQKVAQDGLTLVPLSVYLKDAKIKVELALCKGKKLYDKRESSARREVDREIDRALKNR